METPNDTERNRDYVTVNVDSEGKDSRTQPRRVFLCPKETTPARRRAKGVLLRAMPVRPSMVLIVS